MTLPVKDWIEMQKACDIGIAGRIYQCLPQQFSASMPLPSRFRDKSIFSNINDATDRQRLLLEHLQKCFKYLDSQQKLFITQVIGKYSIDIALALVYLKTLNNDDKVASGSEELIQNLSQDATIGGLQWTRNLLILQAASNYPDQFKQECKSQLSRALLSPRGLDHLMQCLMPGLEDSSAKDVMQEAKALVQIISTPPSLQICSRQAYLENIAEQLWQLIINPNAYCGVAVSVLQRILSSGCELSDYIARVYSVADERLEWRVRGLFYAIDSTSEGNLNTWLLEGNY